MASFEPTRAKIWQRAIAFILDMFLAMAIIVFILTKFLIPEKFPDEYKELNNYINAVQHASEANTAQPPLLMPTEGFQNMLIYMLNITVLLLWIYFVASGLLFKGSSLGKRIFRLTVVDAIAYQPVRFFQHLARAGIKATTLFYLFPIPFLLNYILVFFNKKNLAGHDYICRTQVVEDSEELASYQDKQNEESLKQEDEEF